MIHDYLLDAQDDVLDALKNKVLYGKDIFGCDGDGRNSVHYVCGGGASTTAIEWLLVVLGMLLFWIKPCRLNKIAINVKPATLLQFHWHLVKRKYRFLYSNTISGKRI